MAQKPTSLYDVARQRRFGAAHRVSRLSVRVMFTASEVGAIVLYSIPKCGLRDCGELLGTEV
jgi:hypothetical protein